MTQERPKSRSFDAWRRAALAPARVAARLWGWLRYSRRGGYREDAFWEDRHRRYDSDFRAVAGSATDETERYPVQKRQFIEILDQAGCGLKGKRCVEFGCGNGFWGNVALEQGAPEYTGIDISASAVAAAQRNAPKGRFLCRNLAAEPVAFDTPFDVVFSIDVTQHVVERPKLMAFLANMQAAARPGGMVFVTSYTGWGDRPPPDREPLAGVVPSVPFVMLWDQPTIQSGLPACRLLRVCAFWDKAMLVFQKAPAEGATA
jgi:SAM-dependent methyltransferase